MELDGRLSLLAVFAHPNDESFVTGGTLARYAREGARITLLCATRGEAGDISDPAFATPETLGKVREEELRLACAVLGVRNVRFMDYVDGTLEEVDFAHAVEKVIQAMREVRPQVVLTWGPDGGYGHPDHVVVHEWTLAAFKTAGDPSIYPEQIESGLKPWSPAKLYYTALPRERFQRLGEMAQSLTETTTWDERNWETFGVPEEKVTTCLDVEDFTDTKMEAIATHQTQFSPDHPFAILPRDVIHKFFHEERFVLAESRIGGIEGREDDLFRGIRELDASG